MVTVKGRDEVKRFIAGAAEQIETKVLRGAARAAAKVVADEAKRLAIDDEVAAAIRIRTTVEPGRIVAKVQVKGKGAFKAPWLEYGTDPHFISVDDSQRGGMSVGRINRLNKEGKASLVIGGQFVGRTVFHPGAQPHPFLRPALDMKEGEAIEAAQNFINARVKRTGIVGGADGGDDE